MQSYFNKYWHYFVAGVVLGVVLLLVWVIGEVIMWLGLDQG